MTPTRVPKKFQRCHWQNLQPHPSAFSSKKQQKFHKSQVKITQKCFNHHRLHSMSSDDAYFRIAEKSFYPEISSYFLLVFQLLTPIELLSTSTFVLMKQLLSSFNFQHRALETTSKRFETFQCDSLSDSFLCFQPLAAIVKLKLFLCSFSHLYICCFVWIQIKVVKLFWIWVKGDKVLACLAYIWLDYGFFSSPFHFSSRLLSIAIAKTTRAHISSSFHFDVASSTTVAGIECQGNGWDNATTKTNEKFTGDDKQQSCEWNRREWVESFMST